jgi:hypothetical protein
MSGSRLNIPLEKRTLNLYKGDFDALMRLYPGTPKSYTLRHVLRTVIKAEAQKQGVRLEHIAKQEAQKAKEIEF